MMPHEQRRLQQLLERLQGLERRRVPPHEQGILDVARASVRQAIHEIAHRLHDGDYCRGGEVPRRDGCGVTGGHGVAAERRVSAS